MNQIEDGTLTYGVVPFENSSTGTVNETLDAFFDSQKIQIRAESYQPVCNM
jgi:chorismate mutase/prephenate dehydratase